MYNSRMKHDEGMRFRRRREKRVLCYQQVYPGNNRAISLLENR